MHHALHVLDAPASIRMLCCSTSKNDTYSEPTREFRILDQLFFWPSVSIMIHDGDPTVNQGFWSNMSQTMDSVNLLATTGRCRILPTNRVA